MQERKDQKTSILRKSVWTVASIALIGAVTALILLLSGVIDNNGFLVVAADSPQLMSAPYALDFDEDGDLNLKGEERERFQEAIQKYRDERNAFKAPEGYNPNLAKADVLGLNSKMIPLFLRESDRGNSVYSPINIYIALGMLAQITEGDSRKQALDLIGAVDVDYLRTQISGLWRNCYEFENTRCVLASSLWMSDDLDYNKDILNVLAKDYYASSYSGDMKSESFSGAFSDWINGQTDEILHGQTSETVFDPETVFSLATTLYFEAKWELEFGKEKTEKGIFHSYAGDVQCDYMKQKIDDQNYWGDGFGAVEKKFEGSSSTMMFILPDEGVSVYDLIDDEKSLEFINTCRVNSQSKRVLINLQMPKFDVSSGRNISDDLKKLGMTDVFEEGSADFSPLFGRNDGIVLSEVSHGVRVIADEEGVKGAAITVMRGSGARKPPNNEIDFVLDRPFIFVIRSGDGIPLFVGVVERP